MSGSSTPMSVEIPKRFFKPGEETQVTQINNNCKLDNVMKKLEIWLPKETEVMKKDPVFSPIFKLYENGLGFSARVIHNLLCRSLVTYKKKELWFIFARRPLRFSLQEFHAVTGLECNTAIPLPEDVDWVDDGGFWSKVLKKKESISFRILLVHHCKDVKKWRNVDRIRLVYISFIVCVVLAKDDKAIIPLKYIKLAMDIEKLRKYPWGVAAYDFLVDSIVKVSEKLKKKTTSYVLDGFSYALQIWAMEAVPKIGKLLGKKIDKTFIGGPRCTNWTGAAKVAYDEFIQLETVFARKDITYPYISINGNMDDIESSQFLREDEVHDCRVKALHSLIAAEYDFSDHIWESEDTQDDSMESAEKDENDGDSQGDAESDLATTAQMKGKKRPPDRGMEKRKHKVLTGQSKHDHDDEDIKSFLAELLEQKFAAMEKGLKKHIDHKFEEMQTQREPEPTPTQREPEPTPTQTQTQRKTRSRCLVDLNVSESSDLNHEVNTQEYLHKVMDGLSQASFVPGFDPSQRSSEKPRDFWTPSTTLRPAKVEPTTSSSPSKRRQLGDKPLVDDGSPASSLIFVSEESWERFSMWAANPTPLKIGPVVFNRESANRINGIGVWLGNEDMDAMMYIWRENTSLGRWAPKRVAFMNALFCLQIDSAYQTFVKNKKGYELLEILLAYGKGELPSHGKTNHVWGVDVDRLYFPVFVNGNHWIAMCVNFSEKKVEVFDCLGGKNRQHAEKFAVLIPRILKAVVPQDMKKHLLLSPFSIVEVKLKSKLNKSCCDCGAYAIKHLECYLLGFPLDVVDDDIIMGCRMKMAADIWEAAQDPVLIERMASYEPSKFERSEVIVINEN